MRNTEGKLPYDVKLHAPDDRKKRLQGFAQAAATSFGSSSSASSRQTKKSGHRKRTKGDRHDDAEKNREEITSPLKPKDGDKQKGPAAEQGNRVNSCFMHMNLLLNNQPGKGNQRVPEHTCGYARPKLPDCGNVSPGASGFGASSDVSVGIGLPRGVC